VNNPGNAPVNDMIITFDTTGSVSLGGVAISSTAAGLQVDVGQRRVISAHTDAQWDFDEQWLMEFQPGNNSLSATATVDITFYPGYF